MGQVGGSTTIEADIRGSRTSIHFKAWTRDMREKAHEGQGGQESVRRLL
jgi:hypothetical protein